MKKTYESPEFDLFKIDFTGDVICDSRTEGGAGGGDWGPGGGDFGGGSSEDDF